MKPSKFEGFTLIELMITVAIIGILAAIASPKFADLVNKSKEASIKGKLGAMRSAVTIYYGNTEGILPDNLTQALTNGAKYLAEIPIVQIPKNRMGNPGHVPTQITFTERRYVTVLGVTGCATAGGIPAESGYWMYDQCQNKVFVKCTHRTANNTIWSAF